MRNLVHQVEHMETSHGSQNKTIDHEWCETISIIDRVQ